MKSEFTEIPAEIADLVGAATRQEIPPEVEDTHVLAIMQAASDPGRMKLHPARPVRLGKAARRRTMRTLAATALLSAALGGMAFAGALPDAMQDALSNAAEKVGFHLPASEATTAARESRSEEAQNSSEHGKSVSDDVHSVLDDETLEGKEKGDAVSDAASQNRRSDREEGNSETATDIPPNSDRGPGHPQEPPRNP